MIFSLSVTVLLTVLFSQTGKMLLGVRKHDSSRQKTEIHALTGLVALATLGSLFGFFGLSVHIFQVLVFLFLISRLGFLISNRSKSYRPKKTTLNLILKNRGVLILKILPPLSAIGMISLFQAGFTDHRIAFRTGPDSFGWLDSINFFRNNQRVVDLYTSVREQLGGTSILQSLIPTHPLKYTSIDQIPSFTQQINTEFLIGAHRTGIPFLLGSLANLAPSGWVANIMLGFLGFVTLILARSAVKFSSQHSNSFSLTVLTSLTVVFNVNLLSQTLEGGIGQFFVTPFVLLVIILLLEKEATIQEFLLSSLLLLTFALTSYFEVLIVILPIIAILILSNFRRFQGFVIVEMRSLYRMLGLLTLAVIPMLASIYRLVISPFRYPGVGGWDQGRKPLPLDFLSLTPYLPSGANRLTEQRSGLILLLEVVVAGGVLFFVYLYASKTSRALLFVLFAFYLYFFISIYVRLEQPYNNYTLWKFGAYASTLFPLILVHQNDQQHEKAKVLSIQNLGNKIRAKYPKLGFKLVIACLIATIFTSALWSADWRTSRSLSFSGAEVEFLNRESLNFDFVETGIYPQLPTLYGDIHFGTAGRVDSLRKVKISTPERPVMFILSPGGTCENLGCAEYGAAERKRKLRITSSHDFPDFRAIETAFND